MSVRSLTWKLSLAFLIVSVTGAVVAAIVFWLATQNAFRGAAFAHARADFVTQMANYYQYHHSWKGVADYVRSLTQNQVPQQGPDPGPPRHPPFILIDQQRQVVVPGLHFPEGEQLSPSQAAGGVPVQVDGHVIGTVLNDGVPPLSTADSLFLASTERALLLGVAASILAALGLGVVLARSLTRPVRELTTALHAMGGGELQQAVPVRSRDELGDLSAAFNTMSADLAFANMQRRQMTADIAHDLRTPVTVISGYLEALRDGVLPSSPERFAILYEEAQHLQHLIEDLRTLSLADASELTLHPEAISPRPLLERIAAAYHHQADQAGVILRVEAPDDASAISVDVARITQVLSNLVANALRYTPSGGIISLSASETPQGTQLQVRDTGQGIAPEALPRIFDRFYRADASRSQLQGESSGLGLAIAKAVVEAHGGTIRVTSQLGHGSTFTILLPPKAH